MNCDCGTCADNYVNDREEDYLIERLTHIEEEIAYIKKILKHKRVKENAMEQLRIKAEEEKNNEEEEKKKEIKFDNDIKELIDDIEKELAKRNGNTTTNIPKRIYRHPYPWNLYTWF